MAGNLFSRKSLRYIRPKRRHRCLAGRESSGLGHEAHLRLDEELAKEHPRPAPRKSASKTLGIAVAGDSKKDRLDEAPYPMIYVPLSQNYSPRMTLVAHNTGDAKALKAAIVRIKRDIDPTIPVFNVETMDEHLALRVPRKSFNSNHIG
ncbi:MAG: hypothetical protein ABSH28_23975 [Acidobacteriota bacterium]